MKTLHISLVVSVLLLLLFILLHIKSAVTITIDFDTQANTDTESYSYNADSDHASKNDKTKSHASSTRVGSEGFPIVINTWPFLNATNAGWIALVKSGSALDAIEIGCSQCEIEQCDGTVGYGGSPDESGDTTLDAMIMDGMSHDVGSVAALKNVKQAISVARAVMEYTKHTLLTGDDATRFAVEMGFQQTSLRTNKSVSIYKEWLSNKCQPNFRQNVMPDPMTSCGPYKPIQSDSVMETSPNENLYVVDKERSRMNKHVDRYSHDTIGMVAIDDKGRIAGGTSTNGANHKVPGRVGDSPIAGAGAYVEQGAGGAAATGDGDVMMRFLPSYHAVSLMAYGVTPEMAARTALMKIITKYPDFSGAVIALNMTGSHGGACHGFDTFSYSYRTKQTSTSQLVNVKCT